MSCDGPPFLRIHVSKIDFGPLHKQTVPSKRRRNLFKQQGGECFWCSREMILSEDHLQPRACTVDHVISKPFRNGKNKGATVGACLRCNSLRSHMSFLDFYHLVRLFERTGLPEMYTLEFKRLQRGVRRVIDKACKRAVIRVPSQSEPIVYD